MLILTLILLLTVEAQKNRAPVCAIGLKKGARVRLPGGARKASPALQIRVRKQLPIPIIPGAHVATLKNCREDVGAFRQTCCALWRFVSEPGEVLPDAYFGDLGSEGGLEQGG